MIPEYQSNHQEQYCAFTRHSTEHARTVERLVPMLHLAAVSDSPRSLSILSVGCGDGEFDLLFLKSISAKMGVDVAINYVCVEPDEVFSAKFQASVAERKPPFMKNVTLKIHSQKIEEYLSKMEKTKEQFHVVVFAHSMEHIQEQDSTLLNIIHNVLHDSGECILLHGTENEGVKKFMTTMFESVGHVHGGEGAFEDYAMKSIEQLTERLALKHDKSKVEADIDVTCCFDETSLDGNLILDFVTMKEHARKTMAADELRKNLDLLTNHCDVAEGRKLLKAEIVMINIPKQ